MGTACTKCCRPSDVTASKKVEQAKPTRVVEHPSREGKQSVNLDNNGQLPARAVVLCGNHSDGRSSANSTLVVGSDAVPEGVDNTSLTSAHLFVPHHFEALTEQQREGSDPVETSSLPVEENSVTPDVSAASAKSSLSRGVLSPAREISQISVVMDDGVSDVNAGASEDCNTSTSGAVVEPHDTDGQRYFQRRFSLSVTAPVITARCPSPPQRADCCGQASRRELQPGSESSASIATPVHVEVTQTRRIDPCSLTGMSAPGEISAADATTNHDCKRGCQHCVGGGKQLLSNDAHYFGAVGHSEGVPRETIPSPCLRQYHDSEQQPRRLRGRQEYVDSVETCTPHLSLVDPAAVDTVDFINCSTLSASVGAVGSCVMDDTVSAAFLSHMVELRKQKGQRLPPPVPPSCTADPRDRGSTAEACNRDQGRSVHVEVSDLTPDEESDVSAYSVDEDDKPRIKVHDPLATRRQQPQRNHDVARNADNGAARDMELDPSSSGEKATNTAGHWPSTALVSGSGPQGRTTNDLLNMLRDMVQRQDERRQQQQQKYKAFTRIRNSMPLTSPNMKEDTELDADEKDARSGSGSPWSQTWQNKTPLTEGTPNNSLLPRRLSYSPMTNSKHPSARHWVGEDESLHGTIDSHPVSKVL